MSVRRGRRNAETNDRQKQIGDKRRKQKKKKMKERSSFFCGHKSRHKEFYFLTYQKKMTEKIINETENRNRKHGEKRVKKETDREK